MNLAEIAICDLIYEDRFWVKSLFYDILISYKKHPGFITNSKVGRGIASGDGITIV